MENCKILLRMSLVASRETWNCYISRKCGLLFLWKRLQKEHNAEFFRSNFYFKLNLYLDKVCYLKFCIDGFLSVWQSLPVEVKHISNVYWPFSIIHWKYMYVKLNSAFRFPKSWKVPRSKCPNEKLIFFIQSVNVCSHIL